MKFPQTGGCQCGAIGYEIGEVPQLVYTSHCAECQSPAGSAFSMTLVVAGTAFQLGGTQPPLASTQCRQRAHGHPVGLPELRHVDLQRPKA